MTELHHLTALEQAAAIRARELSPVELTEHYLDRAQDLNDVVGAFITLTPQLALEQAREAERVVLATSDPQNLDPLHGVVVPVKDLNNVAGVRCTRGSKVYADAIAEVDDHVVQRMREAHLIMSGKTNTPEFGMPCYTENDVAPPARTPWDLSRSAGGSSGGAAAAVAAGLASAAHGSDGGGSIRIPSSVCGLVGLKPSRGRVSNGPWGEAVGEFGVNGPIARTVQDAAALLDVMAGAFVDDPHPAPPPPRGASFLAAAGREPGTLRVGRFATPVIADTPVHPDCMAAYEEVSGLLEQQGHIVEDIDVPIPREAVPAFETTWSVMSLLTPVPPGREVDLRDLTRHLRARGMHASGVALASAVSYIRLLARQALSAQASYDVVLTPTLASPPVPVGYFTGGDDAAQDFTRQKEFTPFTAWVNVTGQPALSLPLHWSDEGLPIGIQLVGRLYDEATLIALGAQLEQMRPWLGRHPEVW